MKSIGITGCGKIAQVRHIPEYADHRDARLYVLYDLNPERAREPAGIYIGRVYEIYEELLEDKKIDAVSICVSNELHAKTSIAVLKAGKDVLCERPVAVILEECCRMAETAEETGKCLMTRQSQRLAKGHAPARKLIKHGDIGKIITLKTIFGYGGPEAWSIDPGSSTWFFDKKKAIVGAITNLGIHKTNPIRYLMGERVAKTTVVITTLDKKDRSEDLTEVDDNAICIYKMKSGVVGTMTASWTYYGQEDSSTILYGPKGIMHIYEDPEYCIKIIKPGNEIIPYGIDQIQTNDKQTKSGIIDTLMSCVVHGKEAQLNGKSILSAMETVLASIESAKTGKITKIDQGE